MKLFFLIPTVILLFSSCEQKDIEMSIEPIVDIYAIKNREIPNNDVFYIEGFKDDKRSIRKIFDYLENNIKPTLPFNDNSTSTTFLFDKDDIKFDDTTYYLADDTKRVFISFDENNYNNFEIILLLEGYHKLNYQIKEKKVIIDYEKFNSRALQTFIDVAVKMHKDIKQKEFIMVQKKSNKIEAKINYINRNDTFNISID